MRLTHRDLAAFLFTLGLGVMLYSLMLQLPFGAAPMVVGEQVNALGTGAHGSANLVTAVVLGYRGLDTLGELTILFVAATAAGMVLGHCPLQGRGHAKAGFILATAAELLFPFLILLGAYIILHGHLSPGGGFQGGAIIAAAYYVPLLAGSGRLFSEQTGSLVEAVAGLGFIAIGLLGLWGEGQFLLPLWRDNGATGELLSAGTLPLLYLAVGLKVGSELAGLLARLGGLQMEVDDAR